MNQITRKIILEDGTLYEGTAFGSLAEKKLELVFNTSMVGYQEILSDPSYTDQAVTMTYPIIGNYGINPDDFETDVPSIGALIVREYAPEPSNFRYTQTLSDFMGQYEIAGVSGIDTRELTRKIRTIGSCKVLITSKDITADEGKAILADWDFAHDQVARVTHKEGKTYEPDANAENAGLHIVAIDCGMKQNIVRSMTKLGLKVTVLPSDTVASTVEAIGPDGIFLSNGPGDPVDAKEVIELVRNLKGKYPIFGICLGHQILSLAYGAKTYKLKFGHRGGNHPVKNLLTDKIEITSQNHSFAVDEDSLKGTNLEVTHINLLDNTIEGVRCKEDKAFSIQYHPESAPGPQDSAYLFSQFVNIMKGGDFYA